ncbi:hypothetical protein MY764_04205 [Haemophilus influenzae]
MGYSDRGEWEDDYDSYDTLGEIEVTADDAEDDYGGWGPSDVDDRYDRSDSDERYNQSDRADLKDNAILSSISKARLWKYAKNKPLLGEENDLLSGELIRSKDFNPIEHTPSIFDRNIRGSMTLNNGDAWSSDPQYSSVLDQATINSYDRIERGEKLNLIGRAVGGVFSGVGGVATTPVGKIAEGAANFGLSHVGDLSRQFKSNQEQSYYDSLTPEGKAYYDTRVDFIDKSYKNAREKYETNDKWIDRGITAAQVGLSALGPPGAMLGSGIGLLGKAINKKDTMTKSLRDLRETLNSNALNNHIAQQNELAEKERQAYKEFMAGRDLRSDNTQPKGILNTMHNRMQNIDPDKQVKTSDVPNLRNYWANIIVS